MGPSALDQIAAMIQSCRSNQEIKISRGEAILRINFRLDDLNLWGESAEVLPSANIILACDNDTAEIEESNLTGVVGAARIYQQLIKPRGQKKSHSLEALTLIIPPYFSLVALPLTSPPRCDGHLRYR